MAEGNDVLRQRVFSIYFTFFLEHEVQVMGKADSRV